MRRLLISGILILFAVSGTAFAQGTTNARLGGTVTDATGALIPGADVIATNINTGIVTNGISNETGTYQFASLQPGSYEVRAELPGFQTTTYNNVVLGISQQVRLNFELQVGTVAQTVEVTVTDTQLATSSASVGAVLPEDQVNALPLNSRNVLDLVGTQVGVQYGGGIRGGANAYFAGTQASNVNTLRDGISVNDTRHNDDGAFSVAYTSPDLVQEIRVVVAAADAEYGRGGGQVQMATRSGTNEFHGSLFYTNRNSALEASNWFNNFNKVEKDYANRNQFGGRIGGPIVSNKTFFFFLYDGQRFITKETVLGAVLTEEARQGLLRYFPGVQNGNAASNNPSVDFAGNPVQPSGATGPLESRSVFGLDPVRPGFDESGWVQAVISRMPMPNDFTVGDGLNTAGIRWTQRRRANNDFHGGSQEANRNQINFRIDHNFNAAHQLFITGTRESSESDLQIAPWPGPDGGWASGGVAFRKPSIYTATLVSTLSPTVLNEFRFGQRRQIIDSLSGFERPDRNGPEVFAQLPVQNGVSFIPKSQLFAENFIFGGFNGTRGNNAPRWSASDSLSWTRGEHSFKVGAEWGHTQAEGWTNQLVFPYAHLGAGGVGITGIDSGNFPGANGNDLDTAEALLTDLFGSVNNVRQGFALAGSDDLRFIDGGEAGLNEIVPSTRKFFLRDWRQSDFSAFFKDEWKVSPDVTLNLGVRWDWYGVGYDNNGLTTAPIIGSAAAFGVSGTDWDALYQPGAMNGSLTQLQFVGPNSPNPDRQLWQNDNNNFGPEIGISWNLPWFGQDRTVLRAGYSVSHTDSYDISNLHNAQVAVGTSVTTDFEQAALMTLTDLPISTPISAQPLQSVPVTDRSLTLTIYDDNRRAAYTQSFNASIQRELAPGLTFEIKYLGTKGTKLRNRLEPNQVNLFENGLLDALNITRAGGDAPLFDRMLGGISRSGNTVGVDGFTGSDLVRTDSSTRTRLANGDFGEIADRLNRSSIFGLAPTEVLRKNGLPDNFIVPNPQFRRIRLDTNSNNSTYHSLHAVTTKRLSSGHSYQVQYSWSRTLGIQNGEGQTSYLDPRNRSLNHRLLGYHRTHDFRVNGLVQLPFGPGRALLGNSSGVVARLVEDWQFAAIFNVTSGAPLTVQASTATIYENDDNTPVVLGDISKAFGEVTRVSNGVVYFDGLQQIRDHGVANVTSSLQSRYTNRAIADASGNPILINPEPWQLGTMGLSYFEGPGNIGLDLAATKKVQIGENQEFELRVDGINILNRPNFGNPSMNMNSSSFGRITRSTGERSFIINARYSF